MITPLKAISGKIYLGALGKGLLLIGVLMLNACSYHGEYKPMNWGHGKTKQSESEQEEANENDGDGPPLIDCDITNIPNAVPKLEPLSRYGNPSTYEVLGNRYNVMPHASGYQAEGTASWYGRKFHGQRTSSGEPYDMFGMTAAHRSLPLPTYAKVKNLNNGREVIVKINDRGPFVKDRLIDLSYAAAKKLGIHATGTAKVLIAAIDPVEWHKQFKAKSAKKESKIAQSPKKIEKITLAEKSTNDSRKADQAPSKAQIIMAASATGQKSSSQKKTNEKDGAKTKTTLSSQVATNKKIYIQLGSFSKRGNAEQLAGKATTLMAALNPADVHILSSKNSDKNLYKVRVGPLKSKQEAQKLQKKLVALNGKGSTAKLIYD